MKYLVNVYWIDNQTSSNHVLFVVTQTVFKWLFWASFFHLCNASFSLETNALVSECTPEIIHMAQIPCMCITYVKDLLVLLLLKTTALFWSPGLPFFSVQKSHSEYFGNDLRDLCSSLDIWWTYPFYTACFHSCHPRHTFHKDTPVFASWLMLTRRHPGQSSTSEHSLLWVFVLASALNFCSSLFSRMGIPMAWCWTLQMNGDQEIKNLCIKSLFRSSFQKVPKWTRDLSIYVYSKMS